MFLASIPAFVASSSSSAAFSASGEDAWEDAALAIAGVQTPRGFTDHEHLDDFALVHMNGRIYDPVLGRFLSADPFIQFPESTQGLNRYSYTHNNPLSFTDPSGYVFRFPLPVWLTFETVSLNIRREIFLSDLAHSIANLLGRVFRRADTESPANVFHPADPIETPPQGAGGEVGSEHGRDRFRQESVADSVTRRFMAAEGRIVRDAVVGAIASTLGGQKFANGAVTAAFGRLFANGAATEGQGFPLPREVIDALDPYFENFDLHDILVRMGIPRYVRGDRIVAYTDKNNIFFAPGKYKPTTASGIALIGHEVRHAQQYQELGNFRFRVRYLREYLGGRLSGLSHEEAYKNISFEQAASALEDRIKLDLEEQGYP